MRPPLAASLLCAVLGLVWGPTAAAPVAPDIAALPPKTVTPLTVYPRSDPPKIVSSFPAAGQVIAPGTLVMRITFDQKMDEHGFAFSAASGGRMPDCLKTPRLLHDDKTFVLLCVTAAGASYAMAFNAQPAGGFENIAGARAAPAQLAFATDDRDGPRDLGAALKAAGLTEADMPIATQP